MKRGAEAIVAVVLLMVLHVHNAFGFGKNGRMSRLPCRYYTFKNVVNATDSNHKDPFERKKGPAQFALPYRNSNGFEKYGIDRCWVSPLDKPEWIRMHFKREIPVSRITISVCRCSSKSDQSSPECTVESFPKEYCIYGVKKSGERTKLACVASKAKPKGYGSYTNIPLKTEPEGFTERFKEMEIKVKETYSKTVAIGGLSICP